MLVWLLVTSAFVGHFALHLAIYNRLNATGLRRVTIKRIEKIFIATCIIIPIFAIFQLIPEGIGGGVSIGFPGQLSWVALAYAILCLSVLPVLGIPWLLWRPVLAIEAIDAKRQVRVIGAEAAAGESLAISRKCRWQAKIPFNQIFQLSVEELELPVVGLPASLDGLRISHFSDLHLTGHVSPRFTRLAVEESNRWQPDLGVLTGDLIDKQLCIAWLREIFDDTAAKSGKYFILGNHDTRVRNPIEVRDAMTMSGWVDVGGRSEIITINGALIEVIGNESPWFAAPQMDPLQKATAPLKQSPFRILLSHSPDQLTWARQRGVGLMLAGHTHGGQGRLPLAGPLLSPSWHGSRYASGDFYRAPTTMHVTRGLSGVHLLRLNCRPELSLITLRAV